MIDRGPDRRWRNQVGAGLLLPERRDGLDRRALLPAPSTRGLIRPGVGEARPPRERRRYLDSGME